LIFLVACNPLGQGSAKAKVDVRFSPGDSPTKAIVDVLKNAKSTILVQAYSFTSTPIANALTDAHRRGVKVRVLLDKTQGTSRYSAAASLKRAGIPVWIDSRHSIAHNKVMVVDSTTVITGSFNFTKNAEKRNAENLLIVRSPKLVKKYTSNWERHRKHSKRY
jgi:phosphatidylserine/phosphatidylglycerophosphate/cardiolipin synthase-like enzyme